MSDSDSRSAKQMRNQIPSSKSDHPTLVGFIEPGEHSLLDHSILCRYYHCCWGLNLWWSASMKKKENTSYLVVHFRHHRDRLHSAGCDYCESLGSERRCTEAIVLPSLVRARRSSDLDRKDFEPWSRRVLVARYPECHSGVVHCEYDARRKVADILDRPVSRLSSLTCLDSFCCRQQWPLPKKEISQLQQ
jgi:hypothetical protein